jgi:hypothetical protein
VCVAWIFSLKKQDDRQPSNVVVLLLLLLSCLRSTIRYLRKEAYTSSKEAEVGSIWKKNQKSYDTIWTPLRSNKPAISLSPYEPASALGF